MKTAAMIVDEIIRREGDRFTDHPADRGGPTKYGITLATLREWRQRKESHAVVTRTQVSELTEPEARDIYTHMYFIEPGFIHVNSPPLQGLLVDCGVQHGPKRATEWLQRAIHVEPDGWFGPVTRERANSATMTGSMVRGVYCDILAQRIKFYGAVITKDPERLKAQEAGYRLQAENAAGWMNRLAEFIDESGVL